MVDIPAILRRAQAARANRSVWHNHWDDLARVMLPRRMGFASSFTPGEQRTEDIYDGTPMQAARGLANAIAGLMRPEGEQWVFVRAEDDDIDGAEEAQAWMAQAEQRLNEEFDNPKARFRQATGEVDLDLSVFGSAILFVGEAKTNNLLFQSVHLKDGAVVFDEEGQPHGMFRWRKMTIRQAMQRFGEENLSAVTREKIRNGRDGKSLDEKLEILHAVTLRDEGQPNALFSRNMPWGDWWIEVEQKHQIQEAGFHQFPFAVPRWDTSSGEDYGRSPGMIALPDSNTLQAMGETMLVAGQRAADPALMAPNDGSFSEVNSFPGGLSYYDVDTAAQLGGNPFFPLEPSSNMPLTREMQADMRDQVFRAFFRNVLNLPVQGPQMTATEVMQRKEEFIREIGPVFGRLESDYTGPMVEIGFDILLRGGAFPPVPKILAGRNVRFEYESPVKRIRQQIQASAAHLWALEQGQYAEADPAALDLVNFTELGRFKAQALNLPPQIVNSSEELERRAAARSEAQEAEAQMAVLAQGAEIANTAASAANTAGLTGEAA